MMGCEVAELVYSIGTLTFTLTLSLGLFMICLSLCGLILGDIFNWY